MDNLTLALLKFFEGYNAEQLIALVVALVVGLWQGYFPNFSLFAWMKERLNLDGRRANLLVQILAFALAFVALFVTGELDLKSLDLTLTNLLAYGGTIYLTSQSAYKAWRAKTSPASTKRR